MNTANNGGAEWQEDYDAFLASKRYRPQFAGFEVSPDDLNPKLFDWQREIVSWSLRLGRAALFEDCGLGKTAQEAEWSYQVTKHTGGRVLNIAPLAVTEQTEREGAKFGIEIKYCQNQSEVDQLPIDVIPITNYDRLELFDAKKFVGVVCDESSILKAYTGVTKKQIVSMFKDTPLKLSPTATPAPNSTDGDYMELGNQAEFLGIMPSNEMLSRFFINNAMKTGNYRLKKHADGTDEVPGDYWNWTATWAVCISSPEDLGYPVGGFKLPELHVVEHVIPVDHSRAHASGKLLLDAMQSATTMWKEKAATVKERCDKAAEVVTLNPNEPHVFWCELDTEVDTLIKMFPKAAVVRGKQKRELNAANLRSFSRGEVQYIITNAKMAAFGLNWQHCRFPVFVSPSFSFERDYQALRRHWRYGVQGDVYATYIYAESEGNVLQRLRAKRDAQATMQRRMIAAMRAQGLGRAAPLALADYNPTINMQLPAWLAA